MVRCEQCGKELTAEFEQMPRRPCPVCQSTLRSFGIAITDSLSLSGGSVSLIHTRPGLQSSAQADDQGMISLTASGPSPKNEDDAEEVCARLISVLSNKGGQWSKIVKGEQDIDWYSSDNAGNKLQMQVVRASNNRQLWQQMNETGSAKIEYDANSASRELLDVILNKSKKYPPAQRKEMLLVIDAIRTPSHTFQQVFDAFRKQYLEASQKAEFAQVWAVGPTDELVHRLDQ